MRSFAGETVFRTDLLGIVAAGIGWAPPLRYLLRRQRILALLGRCKVGRAIEVGCGAGALLDDLSRRGFSVTGLETSERALAMARALADASQGTHRIVDRPGIDWVGSMGLVCAFDVLEHIEDEAGALREWISWLSDGGDLMLSVPAHRTRWSAGDEWAGHWRRYDRADVQRLLAAHGLTIVHLECYGFPLANFTEWVGAKRYRRLMLERTDVMSKQQASADSGVERTDAIRLFRKVNTVLGRFAIRGCMLAQSITAKTDWGSGYLVLARRA